MFFLYFLAQMFNRIRHLSINSAAGHDKVQNLLPKKIPSDYRSRVVLVLLNRAINEGISLAWKSADIVMIPKKTLRSLDPNDYRPISITSCLGKLAERLVKQRLYKENNIH